jgi:hypothetical protein
VLPLQRSSVGGGLLDVGVLSWRTLPTASAAAVSARTEDDEDGGSDEGGSSRGSAHAVSAPPPWAVSRAPPIRVELSADTTTTAPAPPAVPAAPAPAPAKPRKSSLVSFVLPETQSAAGASPDKADSPDSSHRVALVAATRAKGEHADVSPNRLISAAGSHARVDLSDGIPGDAPPRPAATAGVPPKRLANDIGAVVVAPAAAGRRGSFARQNSALASRTRGSFNDVDGLIDLEGGGRDGAGSVMSKGTTGKRTLFRLRRALTDQVCVVKFGCLFVHACARARVCVCVCVCVRVCSHACACLGELIRCFLC